MRISITILGLLISLTVLSQTSHRMKVEKAGTFDPSKAKPSYNPIIKNLESPYPGGESYRDGLQKIKDQNKRPKKYTQGAKRGSASEVNVLRHFATYYGPDNNVINPGGTPNDNTLCVSNDQVLITSYNTKIYYHDLKGDSAFYRPHPFTSTISFVNFALENDSVVTVGPFDPKLLYDPNEDRFVLVFLSGRDPDESENVVAFSSSNNPNDPWHVYKITGNPRGDRTWTDYPAIVLTEDELFLTINLLRENEPWQTGFEESVIWQMDKMDGFNGEDSLDLTWWNNIDFGPNPLRNLAAVQGGSKLMGPNAYFISNRNFDVANDTTWIVEVTGTLDDTNTTIEISPVVADIPYGVPPNADQANGHYFDNNDGRVLGAFIEDNEIQLVQTTHDMASGKSAIYHGFIQDPSGNPTMYAEVITHDTLDLGYPNIVFTGWDGQGEQESVIAFDHSSAYDSAGFSCIYYDGNGEYSPITRIVEGRNYVDQLTHPITLDRNWERWGDYFGLQSVYNDPKRVFLCGYYGMPNRQSGFQIAEVLSPTYVVPGGGEAGIPSKTLLFPNPSAGMVTVDFEMKADERVQFEILDLSGKVISFLGYRNLKAGKKSFQFDTVPLATGQYLLRAMSPSDSWTHTFVVE